MFDKKTINTMSLDFNKQGGLIPAIIQDSITNKVLMLGYMNEESSLMLESGHQLYQQG